MSIQYPITPGVFQNPYKEFELIGVNGTDLQAGETLRIAYAHRSMRILTLSDPTVTLRFGDTGAITSLVGAGIGFKHNEAINVVSITNTGGSSVTGLVGLSMGEISDDRLSVSGTINVAPAAGACFAMTNCAEDEVPIPIITTPAEITGWNFAQVTVTTSAVSLIAANPARESVTVQAGTAPLVVGVDNTVTATTGFIIPANSSHTFTHTLDIYGIRASGSVNAAVSEQEI